MREWYEKLILDVSTCAKKGGSNASVDIELIVQKAVKSITETLRIISVNAHKSVVDKTTVTQYQASIEWAKNLVLQSSHTIKAIGINCAASSSSKTGGIEQMRPIAIAIQEQINVEIRRYKLVVQQTESNKQNTVVSVIEHKQNTDTICTGRQSAVNRKEYCEQLEKHVSEVVAESKVIIVSWFSQLIRNVSIRVHQGGAHVEQDVAVLIEQSKVELASTIQRTQTKFASSIQVFEKDKTFALVEYHIQESLKTVQATVDAQMEQVQAIVSKHHSESEVVTEKLSVVLESSKVNITETLEATHTQSVTVIKQETTQTESTVKIIDTVDTVKTAVAHWHTKLTEEIHAISIDTTITNKEERITTLIQEATVDMERVTVEAKSKVTQECSAVKKISKTKEQELLSTIDYVHATFAADVKKVQQVSVEAVHKSDTNIKETLASVIRTSHEKIDTALTRTTAAVIGVATAAIAVHAAQKQEDKKHDELSVNVDENITVMSKWFELFTQKVSDSVTHAQGGSDVVQQVSAVTEHAEQEITDIISTARNDFVKRLSLQNLDQASYTYACKHYEESLETVRVSIVTQIVEVKKVAIEAHTTGNVHTLQSKLTQLTQSSHESIKVAMGSSVVISHKAQPSATSTSTAAGKKTESVVQIEVKDSDAIVIGEQDIEFDRKEFIQEQEKIKKGKHLYMYIRI